MDVERNASDRTGRYSNPNSEYARDIESRNDVDLDYRRDEFASEQASSHDVEPCLYLDPSTRYQSHSYDDEDDLNDGLPFQVSNSRNTGRDRRGMYVPAYEEGPLLGDGVVKRTPSGDCDSFSGSGDSERRSDRRPIHFEKVVLSSPPAVVSQRSAPQSERGQTETISSPLPRQLVLRAGSRSFFNEDTPSPLTSTSSLASPPFASPSVDRGESLVIEPSRRSELTIKPKSSSAKLDSSHGSKYQSASSSVSSNDGDKPAGGKSSANRGGRPSQRKRNVPIVDAVVSDVHRVIKAQVIEVKVKESKRTEAFTDESEIAHSAEKLRKLESIILNISQQRVATLSPEDDDSHSVHETQEGYIAAVNCSEDEQKESDLPMEEESIKEEEFNKTDDDLGIEYYDKFDDQNKITGELDKTATAVSVVVSPSVASDGESTTPSEGNFSSNLQRQGSIRPHSRKPKDGRRKVMSSQPSIKQIQATQTEEQETLKSSQAKSTNALKLTDLTSLSSSTSQRTDSVRGKTGMEKLKKKTIRVGPPVSSSATSGRNIIHTAESQDLRSPEASQDIPCERYSILLRRDERGYGMTMRSTGPVVVQSVRPGGVAEKSGISPGDALVKINGTYVYDKDHDEVIKYIKSAGSFLELTLEREVRSYGALSVHDESLSSTVVQSQSLNRLTVQRPKQTQTSQSFSSSSKRKERDNDLVRGGQGETSAGGKRSVNRGGGGNTGSSYHPPADGQNLLGKDSTLTQMQSTAKPKAPAVEPKMVSKPGGGEVGGGGAGIIGMEFDDLSDEGELPIDPAFSNVATLKQHNAHLAVFLKFLISYSEPAPMLFSMITDYYYAAVKEVNLATRWAFEIYTTFLVSDAPLKLSVDDGMVSSVQNTFKNLKENELRTIFRPVENFVRETILVKELKDLQKKLSIGMLFGGQDLKPNMDRATELKIVDSNLSKHFEEWLATEGDTKQALAFCLATFFRQIGFTGGKNSALLETCPSFIYRDKDKKILKYKLKKNYESKGHTFNPYQFTSITKCQNCEIWIWGIGYQAYQCSNCDLIVHRRCADDVWQLCSGTLRRHKDPPGKRGVRVIGPGRSKIGREDIVSSKSVFHVPPEGLATVNKDKPAADTKVTVGEKVSDLSDADQQSESDNELHTRHLSWPKTAILSENASFTLPKAASSFASSSSAKLSDSDFDIEPELPALSQVLSKEAIRKLKGKERKKQEYINELFYTERTHLRSLKVIDRYFLRPMKADGSFQKNLINRVFSNLDEVIELHINWNKDFKALRQKNEIVNDIGDVLVSRFSGEKGTEFKQIASTFCQDQLYTLTMLKNQQKQNPRLAQILQEATLNGYCARQELKDLLPREMQRLTKYPLLIENICNCTPGDTEEHEKLTLALKLSKELLEHVNHAVRDCENFRRTQDMQQRLDRRPIENSTRPAVLVEYKNLNLTQHKMIYDGELTWRRQPRSLELHVALFEHFIVLLHKQDERLVLRCQNTTIEDVTFPCSPIIKLEHLLTKDVATDKRAFFLINKSSDDPQVYELGAKSKEEKNRWCRGIKEAVEKYHKQYSNEMANQRLHSVHGEPSVTSADTIDSSQRTSHVDGDPNESVEEFKITPATELIPDLYETLSPDVDPKETFAGETENASILLELQEKDAVINEALNDKVRLLADNRQASYISDDLTPQELSIDEQNMNIEDLILRCNNEVVRLSRLGRGQQMDESKDSNQFVPTAEGGADGDDDGGVVVSPAELVRINQKIHRLLEILTVKMVDSEDAEMKNKGMELPSIKSRLSALLEMAADDKTTFATVSGTQKPILRPTSYIAALNGADVNSDHMIRIRPEDDSRLQLLASTMDNLLLSDERERRLNRTTTDDKTMTLTTSDASAGDNVSFI